MFFVEWAFPKEMPSCLYLCAAGAARFVLSLSVSMPFERGKGETGGGHRRHRPRRVKVREWEGGDEEGDVHGGFDEGANIELRGH